MLGFSHIYNVFVEFFFILNESIMIDLQLLSYWLKIIFFLPTRFLLLNNLQVINIKTTKKQKMYNWNK